MKFSTRVFLVLVATTQLTTARPVDPPAPQTSPGTWAAAGGKVVGALTGSNANCFYSGCVATGVGIEAPVFGAPSKLGPGVVLTGVGGQFLTTAAGNPAIQNGATTAVNAIQSGATTVGNAVKNGVTTAAGAAQSGASAAGTGLYNGGKALVNGATSAAQTAGTAVYNGMSSAAKTASNAIHGGTRTSSSPEAGHSMEPVRRDLHDYKYSKLVERESESEPLLAPNELVPRELELKSI